LAAQGNRHWSREIRKSYSRATTTLVLTVFLRSRDPSSRWKQIIEPYPGPFTHHLELYKREQVDDQVREWLSEAWEAAG
jgi:hypothetical protein